MSERDDHGPHNGPADRRPAERGPVHGGGGGDRWHSFDPGSLVAGAFFLTLGLVELFDPGAFPLRVITPFVLVGLVVVGIALALTRRRRRS